MLCAFTAQGEGSIPGQGTKIPHAAWCGQKKIIRKNPVTFAHGCANPYPTLSRKGGPLDTCMTVVAVYASEAVTVGPSGRCLSWQPTPGEAKTGQLAHSSHPAGAVDSGCCYSAWVTQPPKPEQSFLVPAPTQSGDSVFWRPVYTFWGLPRRTSGKAKNFLKKKKNYTRD